MGTASWVGTTSSVDTASSLGGIAGTEAALAAKRCLRFSKQVGRIEVRLPMP